MTQLPVRSLKPKQDGSKSLAHHEGTQVRSNYGLTLKFFVWPGVTTHGDGEDLEFAICQRRELDTERKREVYDMLHLTYCDFHACEPKCFHSWESRVLRTE